MSPPSVSPSVTNTAPSTAVITAIASEEGIDPTELEPPRYETLYSVIDPEALDQLFSQPRGSGTVVFGYCGYEVTVHADGTVEVAGGPTRKSERTDA